MDEVCPNLCNKLVISGNSKEKPLLSLRLGANKINKRKNLLLS